MSSLYVRYSPLSGGGGGGGGVTSLNALTGAVSLIAGTNITITPGAGTLTISDSGSGFSFPLHATPDSAAAPSYSWAAETNTGMYMPSGATVGFAVQGGQKGQFTATAFELSCFLSLPDGTANGPIINFLADTNTGIYRVSPDILGIAAGGTAVAQFFSDSGQAAIALVSGSAAQPGLAFISDHTTGIFMPSGSTIGFTVGGSQKAQFTATSLELSAFLSLPDGASASPIINFVSDTNTGLYSVGPDVLGVTAGSAAVAHFFNDSGQQAVALTAGGASQPSLVFIADRDTGIYSVGANNIGVSTGGTLRLDLNASRALFSYNVNLAAQSELRLEDTSGGEYVGLRASGTQATYTITLPAAAPGSNTFLKYDGANYVWDVASGSGTVTSVAMTVPTFLSVSGSPVTTSGTLAVTLSGTALPIANGGTGQTTASAAFNALSPMTTSGDLIYGATAGAGTRLGIGTAGQVLTVSGGLPIWVTPSGGGDLKADGTVPLTADWNVGAFKITMGSFQTSAASSISGAALSTVNLTVGATNALTGTSQADFQSRIQGSSAATTEIDGFISTPTTAAAAFTAPIVSGFRFATRTKGAGSTVDRNIGFYSSAAPTQGTTGNAIIADNAAFSGNYFINSTSTNDSVLSGVLNVNGGLSLKTRTVTTTATVGANDSVILCNQSAAFALTLPTATDGRYLVIKDFSNTAATNNITVTRAASDLIDGATTFVINTNRQAITLVGSSGNWSII